jgi:hypothetical protein
MDGGKYVRHSGQMWKVAENSVLHFGQSRFCARVRCGADRDFAFGRVSIIKAATDESESARGADSGTYARDWHFGQTMRFPASASTALSR